MSPSVTRPQWPTGLPLRYPTTLIDACWLGDAQRLLLRPVLPQDEGLLSDFLMAQSASARRNRFHAAISPSPSLCAQMSQVDYRRQLALVVCSLANGVERLVAEARYGIADDGFSAEFALMVDERWQRKGLGRWALHALKQAAARAGVAWLEGEVLHDNQPMLGLVRRCGFACSPDPQDERLVRVQCRLAAVDAGAASASHLVRPPGLLQRIKWALAGQPGSPMRLPLAH